MVVGQSALLLLLACQNTFQPQKVNRLEIGKVYQSDGEFKLVDGKRFVRMINESYFDSEEKLKEGWSLSRLIVTDRTLLRLGLYEITSFEETPGRVAINEIIEIAKKYSDETSAKFINGVLSQFVTDEA